MIVSSVRYCDETKRRVNATITVSVGGQETVMDMTEVDLSMDAPYPALIRSWIEDGGVPSESEPPSATPRQARLALLSAGLLDQVEIAVKDAGGATKIAWDYATIIYRDDPLIMSLSASLGLTDAQVDALFEQAATF